MVPLSPRERECLLWAARGKTYTEIAIILGISFGTVKTNLDVCRFKLNCATLPQATATAVVRGILTDEDLGGRQMTKDEISILLAHKEDIDRAAAPVPGRYERWIADALEALLKTIEQKAIVAETPATVSKP